jgi:hypothetical protein
LVTSNLSPNSQALTVERMIFSGMVSHRWSD